MSLIQDALKRKREEAPLLPAQETPPAVPPVEPEPPAPESTPKPSPDKLLLSLVFLIIALLISLGITRLLHARPEPAPAEAVTKTVEPAAEETDVIVRKPVLVPVVEPAPEPEPVPEPEDVWPAFKLSGFASGGGQRMAVINGRMLSAGSRIKDGRVVEIGEDYAVIEYQGKQRTIYSDDQ